MSEQTNTHSTTSEDVLTRSTLHRLMVLFERPSGWSTWQLLLALALPLLATAVLWFLIGAIWSGALAAALILSLAMAGDALLLRRLPAKGISYGPWKAQLIVLAVPRTVAALACGLLAAAIGTGPGLGVLAALEIAGTAALAWGALVEPGRLELTHLRVESPYLPPGAAPIRILHVSDLHVERVTRREQKLLELVAEADPDVIFITGDYLNLSYTRDPQAHAELRSLLGKLSAPYGVYAILGSPPVDERDVVPPLFEGLPIRLLVDEWTVLDWPDGRQLILLGLDCSHDLVTDTSRLHNLLAESPNTAPRVLLYHAPELMPEAARHGIDLYLCGHTHGGQVRLPFYGAVLTSSKLGKRYEMGLYEEGQTSLYVSRGVGLEGLSAPRVRFLSPPEITLVTLSGRAEPS